MNKKMKVRDICFNSNITICYIFLYFLYFLACHMYFMYISLCLNFVCINYV